VEWLNYHHLYYFWTAAREGGVVKASEKLNLAQPTISGQIKILEESLGERLFERQGRGLVLTETGGIVCRYADEIFSLGREMVDTLKNRPTGQPLHLNVGITDVLPKFIASQLLEPAYDLDENVRVTCREGKLDQLLNDMALYNLDLVLADAPVGTATRVRAYNHLLGECNIIFVASRSLAESLREGFPESLNGSPFLLPTDNTELRRSLDQWFASNGIHPRIVAELEDSALAKAFGQSGKGVMAIPDIIEREAAAAYGLYRIGVVNSIRERFYAITPERRLKHPAVIAIAAEARFMLNPERRSG
jgi:LysR family transcriptional regulator, transcriptional activator of nhaA